jgi:hypothetical protein
VIASLRAPSGLPADAAAQAVLDVLGGPPVPAPASPNRYRD